MNPISVTHTNNKHLRTTTPTNDDDATIIDDDIDSDSNTSSTTSHHTNHTTSYSGNLKNGSISASNGKTITTKSISPVHSNARGHNSRQPTEDDEALMATILAGGDDDIDLL
jgi:hypothetical protein